jgi:hypothetical protein
LQRTPRFRCLPEVTAKHDVSIFTPLTITSMLQDEDAAKSKRVIEAMLETEEINIALLRQACG